MLKYTLFFYIFISPVLCQQKYDSIDDGVNVNEREKVQDLVDTLVVESKYKINQVDDIRNALSNFASFQIGMIIGTIREKYKQMLQIYRMIHNRKTAKEDFLLPYLAHRRPIHYFMRMETISHLEFDIEALVHILETINPKMTMKMPKFFRRSNRNSDHYEDIIKYRDDFFKKFNITTKFQDEANH